MKKLLALLLAGVMLLSACGGKESKFTSRFESVQFSAGDADIEGLSEIEQYLKDYYIIIEEAVYESDGDIVKFNELTSDLSEMEDIMLEMLTEQVDDFYDKALSAAVGSEERDKYMQERLRVQHITVAFCHLQIGLTMGQVLERNGSDGKMWFEEMDKILWETYDIFEGRTEEISEGYTYFET